MKFSLKVTLTVLVTAAIAALGTWGWYENMHLEWRRESRVSPVALSQPFFGASAMLRQNGFAVDVVPSVDLVDVRKLRSGTLVLGGSGGVITQAKSDQLLAWVASGNTLVFQPRMATQAEQRTLREVAKPQAEAEAEEKDEEPQAEAEAAEPEPEQDSAANAGAEAEHEGDVSDEEIEAARAATEALEQNTSETDSLSAAFKVRSLHKYQESVCSTLARRLDSAKPDAFNQEPPPCPAGSVRAASLRVLDLPGMGEITFDAQSSRLQMLDDRRVPLWTDNQGDGIRAYQHGRGQIVMAPGDLFENRLLRRHDHAGLLVGLARLNAGHKHVVIVKSRTTIPWYALLWMHYQKVVIALAALLALLFWASVRRFGPMLPDPAPARRSLMEHINASGAWLWKAKGGRQVLIEAARADLLATLQRRAPALLRLSETQQHDELARLTGLAAADVAHAMHYEPASLDAEFTRQIRTLQTLRKHYER